MHTLSHKKSEPRPDITLATVLVIEKAVVICTDQSLFWPPVKELQMSLFSAENQRISVETNLLLLLLLLCKEGRTFTCDNEDGRRDASKVSKREEPEKYVFESTKWEHNADGFIDLILLQLIVYQLWWLEHWVLHMMKKSKKKS